MNDPIKNGDVFTISGRFKHRTFWEWLTRKPRELQRFVVTEKGDAGGITVFKGEEE